MELKNKTKKFRAYLRIEQTNSALSFRVEMSIFQITNGRLLGQLCFCLKLFRNVSGKMVAPIVGQLFDNAGPKKTISLYYPNQISMSNIELILSSTQKYVSKESHDEKLHLFSLGRKMPSPSIDISLTILFLEIKNEI